MFPTQLNSTESGFNNKKKCFHKNITNLFPCRDTDLWFICSIDGWAIAAAVALTELSPGFKGISDTDDLMPKII